MKKLLAMAVPILPGKTSQFKKFIAELNGKRYNEFVRSRKRLDVHERAFFQSTPLGDTVIVTLEGPDQEGAFKNFAAADDDFTNWFAKEVKEIHGFDLKNPHPGPLPELIADSMEEILQS